MESYLKFLEEKMNRLITDMASVHILKKEIKNIKEENEVFKNLLFGNPTLSTLTSDINIKTGCYKTQNSEFSTYNKACVEHEVINKGCLMYRLEKIERSQSKAQDISKEVNNVLSTFEQRINITKDSYQVNLYKSFLV